MLGMNLSDKQAEEMLGEVTGAMNLTTFACMLASRTGDLDNTDVCFCFSLSFTWTGEYIFDWRGRMKNMAAPIFSNIVTEIEFGKYRGWPNSLWLHSLCIITLSCMNYHLLQKLCNLHAFFIRNLL